MDGILLMVEEHKNIKRMLQVVRKACIRIMNSKELDYLDFEAMIDFIINYADNHHHGKEEKFLFSRMIEMGGAAEKLVRFGMLVEHDLGRLYIKSLEEALEKVKNGDEEAKVDVIANSVSYTHLLGRHIQKEDKVAYPFSKRQLSNETLIRIDNECSTFEKNAQEAGIQNKYLESLTKLESKYL